MYYIHGTNTDVCVRVTTKCTLGPDKYVVIPILGKELILKNKNNS